MVFQIFLKKTCEKSSVTLCVFFQGWAGPGGVGPQIGAAGGARVSFNLSYSNLAAGRPRFFFQKLRAEVGFGNTP